MTLAPALVLTILAAGGPPDLTTSRTELLAEVAKERTAHLNHDVELLLSTLADDFVSVDEGVVSHPTRPQLRRRFAAYFGSVDFRAWDDLASPEVEISADGTLATVLIRKLGRTVPRGAMNDPNAAVSETRFAWIEVWRRNGQRWEDTMIVSTRVGSR